MVFWYWWMSKVLEKNVFGEYENVGVQKNRWIDRSLFVELWTIVFIDEERENRKRDNLINNCFCVSIFKIDSSKKMFHERINILW